MIGPEDNDFQQVYPYSNASGCGIEDRQKVVNRYLSQELAAEEMEAFEEHTFYCEECLKELRFGLELRETLQQQSLLSFLRESLLAGGVFIQQVFSSRRVQIAALAVVAIFVAVYLNEFRNNAHEEQRRLFALNSTESPTLENRIAQNRRASGIRVLSPENGLNVKKGVTFKWERQGNELLYIKILSNSEELLHSFSTDKNQFVFEDAAQRLQPGLYYWKLEDEEDLLYVGKFFVNKPDE